MNIPYQHRFTLQARCPSSHPQYQCTKGIHHTTNNAKKFSIRRALVREHTFDNGRANYNRVTAVVWGVQNFLSPSWVIMPYLVVLCQMYDSTCNMQRSKNMDLQIRPYQAADSQNLLAQTTNK